MTTPDENHRPRASAAPKQPFHIERRPLTIDESAAYTGTTPRWIRRAIADGLLPYVKLGKLVRLLPDDLDAFIAENRRQGGQS